MRYIANDYQAHDVDTFLDEILPGNMSATRQAALRNAILDWAEGLAYEHGEERYECGKEAGEDVGHERGWTDAKEELERSWTANSDTAQAFAHRFRDAGWDVRVYDGATDDLAIEMSEHDAWGLLAS